MRKLILFAVVFLLLAAPAFALDTADVTCNIDPINTLAITGSATTTITVAMIDAGTTGDFGTINIAGATNLVDWDLDCQYSAWTIASEWDLSVNGVAMNTGVNTDVEIITDSDPGGNIDIDLPVVVSGLTWANCPTSSDGNATTLTFTIS